MLSSLSIKNVAVISKLEFSVNDGLTVLTGETGAGKSIIIDSINMILGERSNKEIVRYGEEKASVQAVFEDIPKTVLNKLEENDIEIEEDTLIISRQISAEGKSSVRINGTIVPLSVLREIADELINIHGQHDNQALLTPKKHILFLDEYADCKQKIKEYRDCYFELREIEKEIRKLCDNEENKAQRLDLLSYQVNEIESAKLIETEEEDLKEQRNILSNAEKISSALKTAYGSLYDNAEGMSAYDGLSVAVNALAEIKDLIPKISEAYEAVNAAMYSVEDASHEVKECDNGIEFDEQALNEIEERLDTISRLKRKYGATVKDVISFGKRAKEELNSIITGDERLEELKTEKEKIKSKLLKIGGELSDLRESGAKDLSEKITMSLHELNMEKAELYVGVEQSGEFFENGLDAVEFMIRTNPGEPLKPLAKIASGGELSRVILAIKSILADTDGVGTMIFDEIDTGVSGAAAAKITQKLVKIGESKQVICITHLPQLAAAADTHYLILKNSDGEMANTTLKELSMQDREMELARIIDGDTITEISLSHARQMLEANH